MHYSDVRHTLQAADKLAAQGAIAEADALVRSTAGSATRHDIHANMSADSLKKLLKWAAKGGR
jgi:hypothetical protein